MIGLIVGWSLRSRGVVVVVAAALLVLGATQLRDLPVDVLPEFSPPTVEIQTEALGLSVAEVEQVITVPLEQDLLNGVAWLDTIRSESIPGLSRIELIVEPGTGHVELGEVADVPVKPALSVIRHDAVSRSFDVTAKVRGRDVAAVMDDVRQGLDTLRFPLEYHAELVGEHAEQRAAARRALGIAAIAAVLILLLMQAAFGSWRLAGAAFLTLPAALVGGGLLSLGSLVGLVLVLAVAARNAILLISRCQQLARGQDAPTGAGLVMGAAAERLSPILLTAVAIALAVAPLVVRGVFPGYEILQPMAVVVLGGLVTATLLSLFVIPTLYLRFGSTSERRLDAAQ